MRAFHRNKAAIFQYDDWEVVESGFEPAFNHRNETIFSLGNGYMGIRGTFEEGVPPEVQSTPGIYLNGIYETSPIVYGEFMAQQPQEYQTIINVTDWRGMRIVIEGEPFSMFEGKVENYRRSLDLRRGILVRELEWISPSGRRLHLYFERMVSQTNQHLAVICCRITPLNFSGSIAIHSSVVGDVRNYHHLRTKALQVVSCVCKNESGCIISKTLRSNFKIGCAITHRAFPAIPFQGRSDSTQLDFTAEFQAEVGKEYRIEKYVAMATSHEVNGGIDRFVLDLVEQNAQVGYESLKRDHEAFMNEFWNNTDVQIDGDPALQQGARFNALQLLQATGRDGKTNVAAKGLTGEYYEGHYFWDTETYIIPFFLYSQPHLVRKLLEYRYSTLEQARANARRMRNKGALFAWRTINGHEASGNFLGSTVQYHINADIAYAIHKYVEATEDWEFLIEMGAEILFETARCWSDRGAFIPSRGGKYCINEVCGPDEYKPGVNNNCYTNYMAKFNLELAVQTAEIMQERFPEKYQELAERINLNDSELLLWKKCAELMYLPFDSELGIHPQDDSFMHKDPIDVDSIPDDEIPLVANWHPLVIWRYQLIKQADVVLLLFLLGDQFTPEEKKADFDFYEPKTTHDSSLSPAIYSIIASEIGYHEHAYNYFMQTARLDLDDYNKNAWQGVHTACMAGSWMCVVNGFAGMRVKNDTLRFRPVLPKKWNSYKFKVKFKGRQIEVLVEKAQTTYLLLSGESITIYHNGQPIALTAAAKEPN